MENDDIQAIYDLAETQMLQLSDTLAQLKQIISQLQEENNKLRLSNNELRERLYNFQSSVVEPVTQVENTVSHSSGRESLQGFYDEGIHICHEFFGSHRYPEEQCLFCQEIISRLSQSVH